MVVRLRGWRKEAVISAGTSRVPALASDKVTDVRPFDVIFTSRTVVVGYGAAAICPKRIQVAIVGAGTWLSGAFEQLMERTFIQGTFKSFSRSSVSSDCSGAGKYKVRERNHFEGGLLGVGLVLLFDLLCRSVIHWNSPAFIVFPVVADKCDVDGIKEY